MKSLSLTGFTATIATGLLLNVGTANAIGIPVFDVSMVTQTLQNVLQHIQENSLIDGQKKEGTKQLQAMGNIRSMDGLKSFIAGAATEQVNAKFKTPKELSRIGLTDSKMKDPENIRDFLDNWHKKSESGNFSSEERTACLAAQTKLQEELATSGFTQSMSFMQKSTDGKNMKNAKETASSATDQMQQMGANNVLQQMMYAQQLKMTTLESNRMATTAATTLCN